MRQRVDQRRAEHEPAADFDAFGADPAADVRMAGHHPKKFVEWLESALADPWRMKGLRESFETILEYADGAAEVRGGAGFALFADALERASHRPSMRSADGAEPTEREKLIVEAQGLLDRTEVNDFLRAWYDLPHDIPTVGARIHALGTTSFLLHCNPNDMNEGALKCLIPRYAHVRDVADPFAAYSETYGPLRARLGDLRDAVPKLMPSHGAFLWMQFVDGITLSDALAQAGSSAAEAPERLRRLADLGGRLATVLAALADIGQPHLDLAPSNIILAGDPSQPPNWSRPVLVDFGRNTLLSERVVVGDAYDIAVRYIAAEVRSSDPHGSSLSDIYSLGVICLHVASGEIPTAARLETLLARLWSDAPGLARLIEDMLDDRPENRLALVPGTPAEKLRAVSGAIVAEADQARARIEAMRSAKPPFLLRPLPAMLGAFLGGLWRGVHPARPDVAELRKMRGLRGWLVVMRGLWWAIAALTIVLLTSQMSLLDKWEPIPGPVERWLRHASILGSLHNQLPVRLLALTTGLIAFAYYEQIFSTISPLPVGGRRGSIAEASTRGAVLVALALQFIGVLYPHNWAFILTGIGGILVSTNNYVWYRLVVSARKAAERRGFTTAAPALSAFEEEFGAWPQLMMWYSLSGVVVWLLLTFHWAHDFWVYGIGMVLVNVLKLYQFNIVKNAAWARGHLGRSVFVLERDRALPAV